MTESRGFSGTQLLMAFMAGAATGAAVAFMTAPRTGKETREALTTWAMDAREKAARIPQAMRDAVDQGTRAGKEAFAESYRTSASRSES
jgi:gas vesicle protein